MGTPTPDPEQYGDKAGDERTLKHTNRTALNNTLIS